MPSWDTMKMKTKASHGWLMEKHDFDRQAWGKHFAAEGEVVL